MAKLTVYFMVLKNVYPNGEDKTKRSVRLPCLPFSNSSLKSTPLSVSMMLQHFQHHVNTHRLLVLTGQSADLFCALTFR